MIRPCPAQIKSNKKVWLDLTWANELLKSSPTLIDSNRWYHTGDLATMDESGYIKIVGRLKDMIIRGGENVYPSEIENCLLKHKDVLDVQVVGAPDYRLGEVVVAYVRVRDGVLDTHHSSGRTEDQIIKNLKEFCQPLLAKYKIPKHWKILDAYPATLSGKVKKFMLRERCLKDFDLEIK